MTGEARLEVLRFGGAGELDVFESNFTVFSIVFLLEVHFASELYGANFPAIFTKHIYHVGILFVEVELYSLGSFGAYPVGNLESQGAYTVIGELRVVGNEGAALFVVLSHFRGRDKGDGAGIDEGVRGAGGHRFSLSV